MRLTTITKALDVLAAIEGQTKARRFPPTLLEVGKEVGISSSSHMAFYVKLLVEMELLSYEPRIPGSFVVLITDPEQRMRRVNEFIMTRYKSTDRPRKKKASKPVTTPAETAPGKRKHKKWKKSDRHAPRGVKETV